MRQGSLIVIIILVVAIFLATTRIYTTQNSDIPPDDSEIPIDYSSMTFKSATYIYTAYDSSEHFSEYPEHMVDGEVPSESAYGLPGETQLCVINNCPLSQSGIITAVKMQVYIGTDDGMCRLQPVFNGVQGSIYDPLDVPGPHWASFETYVDGQPPINITNDANAPIHWSWSAIRNLDIRVISDNPMPLCSSCGTKPLCEAAGCFWWMGTGPCKGHFGLSCSYVGIIVEYYE